MLTAKDFSLPEGIERPALDWEEPLIFEQDGKGRSGVDLPEAPDVAPRLGEFARSAAIGLPGLSEPQVVRHFVRLSRRNYAIDLGIFPLGSCTMKHNPRLNEKLARLKGLGDLHPLQPQSTVQGALGLMAELGRWLQILTGLPVIALSPAAGAQGELCGLMAIRAALGAAGDPRRRVLVPESAHGTNPATAAFCGYRTEAVRINGQGRIDIEDLRAKLGEDVAAAMLTNPNTCGLFESEILAAAEAVHACGAFLYLDGANFNAMVGKVRPADLGVDVLHLNLHKTFSTPHGGGGPGSGPVALAKALAPFAPLPYVVREGDCYRLVENEDASSRALGRLKAFHGQMGMFIRALAYMHSHGADGLKQVAEDAVITANYVRIKLQDAMSVAYPGPCMHEVLFDDKFLQGSGVTTLDFAKALIDEGFHPMTVYFPLIARGAMLLEPTETESKDSLDALIASLRRLAAKAKAGASAFFASAPRHAPRRRLDEALAARKPKLRWRPPAAEV